MTGRLLFLKIRIFSSKGGRHREATLKVTKLGCFDQFILFLFVHIGSRQKHLQVLKTYQRMGLC